MVSVGIDVSKFSLSCALAGEVREFPNSQEGFDALLEWTDPADRWCMEATGRYHERLVQALFRRGKRCLVVNPGRAKKYLCFVDSRAKTDRVDALSLARLAEREGENLREYKPVPPAVQEAKDILVQRRALVENRVALEQVAQATGDKGGHLAAAIAAVKSSAKALDMELEKVLKTFPSYQYLLTIPGVGPVSAAVLVCALERGEFVTSDALVAYAGLDPRASDSGRHRGKRRLSHQGDSQLRSILFMAARAGARQDAWKHYYNSQLAKGLPSTAATVILARKLLRVAWSVHRQGGPFIHRNGQPVDKQT